MWFVRSKVIASMFIIRIVCKFEYYFVLVSGVTKFSILVYCSCVLDFYAFTFVVFQQVECVLEYNPKLSISSGRISGSSPPLCTQISL